MHSYLDVQEPQFSKIDRWCFFSRRIIHRKRLRLDTCALIVVLNAALHHPSIISVLPDYVFRHYRYLRTKEPDLTPNLQQVTDAMQNALRAYRALVFVNLELLPCASVEDVRCGCFTSSHSSILA